MTLREALAAVREKHGSLTPQAVVDEARANRSAAGKFLHGRLEWDDSAAAEAWRRTQAQELIRSLRVRYREPTETEEARSVRAYHAVPRPDGHVYEPLEVIEQDEFTRNLVLRDMEREWMALKRRYEHFVEFLDLVRGDLEQMAA
jgi:hypothetical protein